MTAHYPSDDKPVVRNKYLRLTSIESVNDTTLVLSTKYANLGNVKVIIRKGTSKDNTVILIAHEDDNAVYALNEVDGIEMYDTAASIEHFYGRDKTYHRREAASSYYADGKTINIEEYLIMLHAVIIYGELEIGDPDDIALGKVRGYCGSGAASPIDCAFADAHNKAAHGCTQNTVRQVDVNTRPSGATEVILTIDCVPR